MIRNISELADNRRLNYILWIQDLLDSTSSDYRDDYDPDRDVTGLDMYVIHTIFGAS